MSELCPVRAKRGIRNPRRRSGPAGIQTSHSDFARRKFCATLLVRVPRNGVRGKATMSTKCSFGAVPGGVLVNLSRTPGEVQRSGFAGKRRSKEAVAVFAARRKRRQTDFATTCRHGQSNSPPAGGEIPLRRAPGAVKSPANMLFIL